MQLIVGTRGSRLALKQTELILGLLRDRFPAAELAVEIVRTEGDRVQNRPISEIGDKGVFVRAIERALLQRRIDLAVHSLKDVPSDVDTPGLCLAAFSPREDPRDVLLSRTGAPLESLPPGALVGTGSLRRRAQLRALRPDLVAADIRGNVDTRIRKLDSGEYDALLLAAAGLLRLGLADRITRYLPVDQFVPDAGQGIIAVQTRADDKAASLVNAIGDRNSRVAAISERSIVRALGAGCRSPVGAHAVVEGDRIWIRAMAASEDGTVVRRAESEGAAEQADSVGWELGVRLLALLRTAAH